MGRARAKNFDAFWKVIEEEIHEHPVIVDNLYCKWFKRGEASAEQMADLFEQFAIFSKWFLLVQMMRMLHAAHPDAEARARYILVNELGVGMSEGGETENQPFKTEWAHINWLRETARPLHPKPAELGSWETASPETREFIEGLEATYGNKDGQIGRGASYAIETWAAWGIGLGEEAESNNFWKELIGGIEKYNERNDLKADRAVPLGFFLWHFNTEKGHGDNVLGELRDSFYRNDFDDEKFIDGGRRALNALHAFWMGLDQSRKALENGTPMRQSRP